jgi:uncharacterized protein involved in exopolysaccharide biosynthesis
MLGAMYSIAQRLSRSEATRRTEFYDTLIAETQIHLAKAIEELRVAENQTGLTRLKGQEEGSSAALVELQGQIATREVELKKMAISATDQHPEVVRVKEELDALRQQVAKHFSAPRVMSNAKKKDQQDIRSKERTQDLLLPFESYSNSRALVEPLRRSVDNYAGVLEQLIRAQALSRVDETRDFSGISVLDEAVAPTRKSGPRVYVNAAVGGLAGLFLAIILALIWDILFTDAARRARWRGVYRSFARRGR